MTPTDRYRVRTPGIVHEHIDDEVVVIDMESGAYYSLVRESALAWQSLDLGLSGAGIAAAVGASYEGDQGEIEASVFSLLQQLVDEGLVEVSDRPGMTEGTHEGIPDQAARAPFQGCGLERFNDMQDLLLLDPIHDVDESGWPSREREDVGN
ncbi:PqqD family protein [Thioalkalivibrio thiocyanodenitrificans]|uniref:PqqD family protein n=1 Tax=Thioalkalivibrio thiocyanodenitrificans TaxID=243063 RepID=UPI00036E51FC|nr:PqqD family protein [Thioalkalivibrio thiocyanodenitrificans]